MVPFGVYYKCARSKSPKLGRGPQRATACPMDPGDPRWAHGPVTAAAASGAPVLASSGLATAVGYSASTALFCNWLQEGVMWRSPGTDSPWGSCMAQPSCPRLALGHCTHGGGGVQLSCVLAALPRGPLSVQQGL